jgi:hypothetical protein
MSTYKIIRFYADESVDEEIVATGLTLAQAQAHCRHPETSSSTAHGSEAQTRTLRRGPWFDGYEEES